MYSGSETACALIPWLANTYTAPPEKWSLHLLRSVSNFTPRVNCGDNTKGFGAFPVLCGVSICVVWVYPIRWSSELYLSLPSSRLVLSGQKLSRLRFTTLNNSVAIRNQAIVPHSERCVQSRPFPTGIVLWYKSQIFVFPVLVPLSGLCKIGKFLHRWTAWYGYLTSTRLQHRALLNTRFHVTFNCGHCRTSIVSWYQSLICMYLIINILFAASELRDL